MSEQKNWLGIGALALLLACTVGETPPEGPTAEPGAEPVPEAPGEEPGAGDPSVDAGASELLARAQLAYEAAEVEEALRLSRQVLSRHEATAAASPARWVAARAAFAMAEYGESREQALAYASGEARGSSTAEAAREVAELAADAQQSPADVVVGAVLPRSGPRVLVRYGDWLLEGIELAVSRAERAQGRRIELVVADDAGGARVREAVREVEGRGAVAVIGPVLPQHLSAAVDARRDPRLVFVSPTFTDRPRFGETYSVNASDARGAQELGRYAADVGLRQAAVLYPRLPEYEQKARAFTAEFEDLGGEIRVMVAYDSGTTSFGPQMERILRAVAPDDGAALGLAPEDTLGGMGGTGMQQPFALFVPALQRAVPQIAPQVSFYDLDSAGVQVLGDEGWASAPVRRLVPDRDLEGVIAASAFPPERADAAADPDFIAAYEGRYRKSLENQLPALGYDAAHLIAQALPNRMLSPGAFARRFSLLSRIQGATGLLSVRSSRLVRTSYLVMLRDGQLVPAPYPWEYELPVVTPSRSSGSGGGASR